MTQPAPPPLATRGASANPPNRFEKIHVEPDPDCFDPDEPPPRTEFFKDSSATIIAYNDSPDVGFSASVNPYRGCEHGCAYCYARPFHEYLGFSAGLDFETKIMVKLDAPELLRAELSSPRWQPQAIAMSGVTDAYQPVERKLQITRRCLKVLAEFRNPVGIVTKNHLVTRDADLLGELAKHNAAAVFISLTTLDTGLRKKLEPRTSPPSARLAAIETLSKAGIPVGVMIAPVIPGLNDHEIPVLLEAAASAGAQFAGHVLLRLPYAVSTIFESWLDQHAPLRKDKVLNQIRSMRGGELNDARFGSRMRGEGELAEQVHRLFTVACRKHGFTKRMTELSTASFRRPGGQQLSLFGQA
jgi:DNA repair photolyase